jgi:hypothetical protein
MAPKAIRPETDVISCAVCGRRLLQGERPEIYLAGGTRRTVCELCTVRANQQGWIRETGTGPQLGHRGLGRDERRPRFRLRSRRGRHAEGEDAQRETPPAVEEPVADVPAEEPQERPREPRHVHAVPTSDDLKASRALEVFNSSEHPRTVAGVARSLGAPSVSIRPHGVQPSVVSIAVSWELCWYRYEVDLADAAGPQGVRLAEQGYELSELATEDQEANGAADEHGVLALAAVG